MRVIQCVFSAMQKFNACLRFVPMHDPRLSASRNGDFTVHSRKSILHYSLSTAFAS